MRSVTSPRLKSCPHNFAKSRIVVKQRENIVGQQCHLIVKPVRKGHHGNSVCAGSGQSSDTCGAIGRSTDYRELVDPLRSECTRERLLIRVLLKDLNQICPEFQRLNMW